MKKTFTALISAIVIGLAATCSFASPAQIILIRHGEKPAQGNELNQQGFARAKALVNYFQTDTDLLKYGTPVAIYAMKPSGPGGSVRPIQTVTPLADTLGLPVIADYLRDDADGLVNAVLNNKAYDDKMVLICWEHNAIPAIVSAFANAAGTSSSVSSSLPSGWDGSAFDRTWILNLSSDGKITSFQDLPQHLMPGDSDR